MWISVQLENILWVMKDAGEPKSVKDIAETLEAVPKDISSRMGIVYKRLEPKELMGRYAEGMSFMYYLTEKGMVFSVEELYQAYSKYGKPKKKRKKAKPKSPMVVGAKPPKPPDAPTGLASMFPKSAEALEAMFMEAVAEAMRKRGLAVQVTGEIKVLFGWVK